MMQTSESVGQSPGAAYGFDFLLVICGSTNRLTALRDAGAHAALQAASRFVLMGWSQSDAFAWLLCVP